MGAVGYLGLRSFGGGGAYFRLFPLHADDILLGVALEGGWLWAGAGVPVGLRLNDSLWLNLQPGVQIGIAGQQLKVPIGLALWVSDGVALSFESGFAATRQSSSEVPPFQIYGGAAVVTHF